MNKYEKRITLNNTTVADSLTLAGKSGGKKLSLRAWRWIVIIAVQILFIISFRTDTQVLEGMLMGSRFLGFHMIDPFIWLQYIMANKAFPINLTIGSVTVVLLYLVFGRAFCSWVCPYGLISELGEKLNAVLVSKRIIRPHRQMKHINYAFWFLFLFLCFTTGYLVFEIINVVGIMSRLLIYGVWLSSVVIVAAIAMEVLYSRRIWCKSICPVGATYGLLNKISAVKVVYTGHCDQCGSCRSVCHAPHLLDLTNEDIGGQASKAILGTDCTMCGRCIDVCHKDTLQYKNRLKKLI